MDRESMICAHVCVLTLYVCFDDIVDSYNLSTKICILYP